MIFRHRGTAAQMESCRQAVALLQSYMDDELDEETRQRVAAHVNDCYQCGLEMNVYQLLRASLRRKSPVPASAVDRLQQFALDYADLQTTGHGPTAS